MLLSENYLNSSINLVKLQVKQLNTHKPVTFLNTKNKRSEREIQEIIPFTITSKRVKYLGINLPKETKDLYSKNADERTQR